MKMQVFPAVLWLSLAATAARAAEFSSVRVPDPAYDWAGPYIGMHLGYGWAEADFTDASYNGGNAFSP